MLAWAARWPLPGSQRPLSRKRGVDPQKRPPARAAPGTLGVGWRPDLCQYPMVCQPGLRSGGPHFFDKGHRLRPRTPRGGGWPCPQGGAGGLQVLARPPVTLAGPSFVTRDRCWISASQQGQPLGPGPGGRQAGPDLLIHGPRPSLVAHTQEQIKCLFFVSALKSIRFCSPR